MALSLRSPQRSAGRPLIQAAHQNAGAHCSPRLQTLLPLRLSRRRSAPYVIPNMILQFKSINNQKPGILASLLRQSYVDLIKADPIHWKPEENDWNEFDRDAFGNPKTIGACVFLSWHGKELIGFASFDPRQAPEIGIIGHNCILPEFRGRGFGKQQIYEILDRFMILGIQKAKVTTNDNPFFVPAQRMYKSSGFHEIFREPWERDRAQSLIHYQKRIG